MLSGGCISSVVSSKLCLQRTLTCSQVYFGTSHPRSYISANVTGIKCVTGMSCLMRKDVLDQAGGLVAFAQYIAEDYFMAKAIADRSVC